MTLSFGQRATFIVSRMSYLIEFVGRKTFGVNKPIGLFEGIGGF
jgi:hypothetical protein